MIIPIEEELRIRSTEHCWQLEKAIIRKGKRDWAPFKYYKSLPDAIGSACRREIRLDSATSLKEAIQSIDRIVTRYNRLLDDSLRCAA